MPAKSRPLIAAYLMLAVAVIGFVLFSQYGQGYKPCELCLRERWPWYIATILGVIGLFAPSRGVLAATGLVLLVSAGLGLHHVGVEQRWWAGPAACTGGSSGARTVDELRAMMHAAQLVSCDEISWTLFGISMATYNFLLSLAAGAIAVAAACRMRRPHRAS